jgi:hypothetical protein
MLSVRYNGIIFSKSEIKLSRALNFLWIGFIIYTLAYVGSTTGKLQYSFWFAIQSFGLLFFLPSFVYLLRLSIESKYLKFVYPLYCCWLVAIVLRGLPFNVVETKELLFDAWYGGLLYIVPLVLLLPKDILFLKKLFDVIVIFCIAYIVYDVIFLNVLLNASGDVFMGMGEIEFSSKTLSLPAGFLLLTYIYQSDKRKLLAVFTIILTLFFALVRARRGLSLMVVTPIIGAAIIFLIANRRKPFYIVLALLILAAFSAYGYKFFNDNKKGLFSLITERADENTRTTVEEFFYHDMKQKDWVIGRGVFGEYYCPGVDNNGLAIYRRIIETDYLSIILKGGIISLGLLLLIAVPAIFKGFFYSRNILSKAAAMWILLWLLDLYPATVTTFTLHYIIVWVCIGICFSQKIRMTPEEEVKLLLKTR